MAARDIYRFFEKGAHRYLSDDKLYMWVIAFERFILPSSTDASKPQ